MATTEFRYPGTELDALAEAGNYYAAILRSFEGHLGRRVVEVGAGLGTVAEALLRVADPDELTLIEPADNNVPRLRARFADEPRVRVVHGYLEAVVPGLVTDSVVAVNVLEHVEDDVALLRAARAALAPTGKVLLFVPALMPLYGSLDRAFGHVRRYTKGSLEAALRGAGLRPIRIRYFNLPGVATWFLAGRVLRRTTLWPADVRRYDRWVVPWMTRLERRWEPPVGQSLVAVAERAEG